MIKVAGNWEYGWLESKQELFIWSLLLREFEIRDLYMWPKTGIKKIEPDVELYERETIKEILDENRNLKHVYFETQRMVIEPNIAINLKDFEHPKDALYIFGSANYSSIFGNKTDDDLIVTVSTLKNLSVAWPHQILAIVLSIKE